MTQLVVGNHAIVVRQTMGGSYAVSCRACGSVGTLYANRKAALSVGARHALLAARGTA
jgi:hypothetical protein